MGAELIIGRAGRGKSRYVLSRIREVLSDPFAKAIVIVPEQYTFQMERDIMEQCGVCGFFGLGVFSFPRLVHRVLEEAGGRAGETLNAAAKSMLVRRAALEHAHSLQAFRFSASEPGFDRQMAEIFSDMKRYDVSAQALTEKAQALAMPHLRQKARDIALLYGTYEKLLQGRADAEDLVNTAVDKLRKAPFAVGAHLFVDGFDMLTAQYMRLLKRLIALSRTVHITFRAGEKDDPDAALFGPETEAMGEIAGYCRASGKEPVYKRLPDGGLKPRHASPELAHLERNLYAYPYERYADDCRDIALHTAATRTDEALYVAENILRLVRKDGCRFRDIAVIADIPLYADLLKSVFLSNGIPCFVDSKRALIKSRLAVCLDAALSVLAGRWRIGDVLRYVKSGYAGLTEDEEGLIARLVREKGLRGYDFKKPFAWAEEAAERARQTVAGPLLALERDSKAGMAEALLRFTETLRMEEKTQAFEAQLQEAGWMAEASFYAQAAEKTMTILREAKEAFGDVAATAAEWKAMLRTAFESVQIAVIPPAVDEVTVGDLERSRLKTVRALFVMGLNEGVIPARADTGGILTQDERATLEGVGIRVGRTDKAEAERLNIYTALTKPKERLFLSCSLANGGVSILADRIRNIFPRLRASNAPDGSIRLLGPQGTLRETAAALRILLDGGGEAGHLRETVAWYLHNGYQNEMESLKKELLFENEAADIGRERARALYGGLRGSVSRIEEYYACPFKHFVHYGLKAREIKEYAEYAADAGLLLHAAVDRFSRKLKEQGVPWREADDGVLEKTLSFAWEDALAQHPRFAQDKRQACVLPRLRQEFALCAKAVRWQLQNTRADVLGTELRYGPDEGIPAFRITLANGGTALLSGCVDRADCLEADGAVYVRVVDYKLSEKKFDHAAFFYGVDIQLPVYLMLLVRHLQDKGKNAKPAGAYYYSFALPFADDAGEEEAVFARKRMKGFTLDDIPMARAFGNMDETGMLRGIGENIARTGDRFDARSRNRVFAADEMDRLFAFTRHLIQRAVEGVYSGLSPAAPAAGQTRACDYCRYGSICRFDPCYENNRYKKTGRLNKAELLAAMREAADDDME